VFTLLKGGGICVEGSAAGWARTRGYLSEDL
jgi:hypothetical protein